MALLLAACGSAAPASGSATTAATSAPTQAPGASEPNPLNVSVILDDDLAASAVISAAGGSLSAQAADGAKFTLVLPEGALQGDETITLTPLSGVEGLPFSGGVVGGVQLAPEGLRLLQPATLTIESPDTTAAEGFETVAFGYHEDGQGVYLNPSTIEGNVLTLEIWHFSGAAAAQATPTEIQTQHQEYVPSIAEDAFTQRVMEYQGIERQAQMMGEGDPEGLQRMNEFLREAYDSFIAPQLPIALADCSKARGILSRAMGWARQATLLGPSNENENVFRAEIDKIVETARLVEEKCSQNYIGEGKYSVTTGQAGLELKSSFEFQITFSTYWDGTIEGVGVLKKTENSISSEAYQCTDPDVSSLEFPPMKVKGTVIPDDTGQPGIFQLTIAGLDSSAISQLQCVMPSGSWTIDTGGEQQGFILDGIEIAAADGAEANGEDVSEFVGMTTVTTWELEIQRQENP
ncbi:MAG: hypothetical protein WD751_11530 [Anaerolineales bacterium]